MSRHLHKNTVLCLFNLYITITLSSFLLPEDEQRNKLTSQKALHTMSMEKEAALADLNSVERSLSDVFRRYENMKSTLEGFKKVSGRQTNSGLRESFQSRGGQVLSAHVGGL